MPPATFDPKPILRQRYERESWSDFLREIFAQADLRVQPHAVEFSGDVARQLFQLGVVTLPDGKRLGVFEIELASASTKITRNRVGLRDLARRLIDEATIHGALAVFFHPDHDEYRFSFISRQSRLEADGTISTTETHPK